MGLILDTSVLISGERRAFSPKLILQCIKGSIGETDHSISVISILELEHGVHRARSPEQSRRRAEFISEVCAVTPVVPISFDIARLAGKIEAQQATRGLTIDLADLLIGATALYLHLDIVTLNPKHFALIPGLNVMTF